MNAPKKRGRPVKGIDGGSSPLATASSPEAAVSSATPTSGGHPRNAPGGQEEWQRVTIEDITSILGDGLHGTPKYDANGKYYFINGNNLCDGRIVINENTKRASIDEFQKYKKNLNERTILVSINGTIGNVAVYNGENV